LGFGLKTANEIRMIGMARQNDFDSHLTLNRGLGSTIDNAKATTANLFTQLEAFDGTAT
jgi:hypothetical protein